MKTYEVGQSINRYSRILSICVQGFISILLLMSFIGPAYSFPNNRKLQALLALIIFTISIGLIWKNLTPKIFIILIYMGILIIWSVKTIGYVWLEDRHVYHSLAAMGFALLLNFSYPSKWTVRIPFVLMIAISFFWMFILHEDISDGEILNLNRNVFVRVQLISAMTITVSDYFQGLQRPKLWPGVMTFIMGILSQSRAGLGMSIVFLLLLALINIFNILKNSNRLFLHLHYKLKLLISGLGLVVLLGVFIAFLVESRFAIQGLASSERIEIYASFINQLTFKNFITGFKPAIFKDFDHLHNSFLQLIALNGLGAIPVILYLLYTLWILFKKSKLLFVILGILCVYSMVEHTIFFYIGDFVLFPLFIAILSHNGAYGSLPKTENE